MRGRCYPQGQTRGVRYPADPALQKQYAKLLEPMGYTDTGKSVYEGTTTWEKKIEKDKLAEQHGGKKVQRFLKEKKKISRSSGLFYA